MQIPFPSHASSSVQTLPSLHGAPIRDMREDVRNDAFETLGRPHSGCIVYTCEHASNRVPAPLRPTPSDRALLRTQSM